jgi:hypothetical protein
MEKQLIIFFFSFTGYQDAHLGRFSISGEYLSLAFIN